MGLANRMERTSDWGGGEGHYREEILHDPHSQLLTAMVRSVSEAGARSAAAHVSHSLKVHRATYQAPEDIQKRL